MEKSQQIFTWFLCVIFFSAVNGKISEKLSEVSELSIVANRKSNDWQLCDFRRPGFCDGIIAESRWQLSQEGDDSFLLANFKPGESSVLSYASLVKPPMSHHVCLIVKHFRNFTKPPADNVANKYIPKENIASLNNTDDELPKIFIGIEPEISLPFIVNELVGPGNEWITDYFQLSLRMTFRFFVKVQNLGVKDSNVALQYLEIREGNCNSVRKRSSSFKAIQEMEQTEDNFTIKDNNSELKEHENNKEETMERDQNVQKRREIKNKYYGLKFKRESNPFGNIGKVLDLTRSKKEVKSNDSAPRNITTNVQYQKSFVLNDDFEDAFTESGTVNSMDVKNKASETQIVSSEVKSDKLGTTNFDFGSGKLDVSDNNSTSSPSKSEEVINEENATAESTSDNLKENGNKTISDIKSSEFSKGSTTIDEMTKKKKQLMNNGVSKKKIVDTLKTVTIFEKKNSSKESDKSKSVKNSFEMISSDDKNVVENKKPFSQNRSSSSNKKKESYGETDNSVKETNVTEHDNQRNSAPTHGSEKYENTEDFAAKNLENFQGKNSIVMEENSSDDQEVENSTEKINFKEENSIDDQEVENSTEKINFKNENSSDDQEVENSTAKRNFKEENHDFDKDEQTPSQKDSSGEITISMRGPLDNFSLKGNKDSEDGNRKEENDSYISNQSKLLLSLHRQPNFSDHSNIQTRKNNIFRHLESSVKTKEYSPEVRREENGLEPGDSEDEIYSRKVNNFDENVSKEKFSPVKFKGSLKSDSIKPSVNSFSDSKVFHGNNDKNSNEENNIRNKGLLKSRFSLIFNEDGITYDSPESIEENPKKFALSGNIYENFYQALDAINLNNNRNKFVSVINFPKIKQENLSSRRNLHPREGIFPQPRFGLGREDLFNDLSYQPKYAKSGNIDKNSQLASDALNLNTNQNKLVSGINFPKMKHEKLSSWGNLSFREYIIPLSAFGLGNEDLLNALSNQPKFSNNGNIYENSHQASDPLNLNTNQNKFVSGINFPKINHKNIFLLRNLSSREGFFPPPNFGLGDEDSVNNLSYQPKYSKSGDIYENSHQASDNTNEAKPFPPFPPRNILLRSGGGRNIKYTNGNNNSPKPSQIKKERNLEHKFIKYQTLPAKTRPRHGEVIESEGKFEDEEREEDFDVQDQEVDMEEYERKINTFFYV